MISTLAAAALALSTIVIPPVADPPPTGQITIDVVTVNGSGCRIGTAAVAVSPDNKAFTVTYSEYLAQVGPDAFDAWGWRIPFAVSIGLLGVSVWMRMKLTESPAFAAMQAEGEASKAPYAEAFGQWKNLKLVLLAFFAMMSAQGAVWYTSFFYVQTFMEKFLKVDPVTINELMMTATAISAVFYVVFGWLSDKVGRKPIILGGMALASLTYYPLYTALGNFADPANLSWGMSILIVVILVNYVGMTYGPIGAFLAEFFPSRIRYTSVSVPYHIGNGWGGGLVPIVTTAAYLNTGSLGWALAYPIAVPAVMCLIAVFVMPETHKHSIWEEGAIEASRSRA